MRPRDRAAVQRGASPGGVWVDGTDLGGDVHEVWGTLAKPGRFLGVHVEDLVPVVCGNGPDPGWAAYMTLRYGGME